MKKITHLLISTCALAFISNVFGMLNQKTLISKLTTHKKIQQFHTSTPAQFLDMMTFIFAFSAAWDAANAASRGTTNKGLLETNKELLCKIVQQNGIIIKQNHLIHSYNYHRQYLKDTNNTTAFCSAPREKYLPIESQLEDLYKKHGIKIE